MNSKSKIQTPVTFKEVKQIDLSIRRKFKTIGSCVSSILRLDMENEINQEPSIIYFLVECKKKPSEYQKLASEIKKQSDGSYLCYDVLLKAKNLIR